MEFILSGLLIMWATIAIRSEFRNQALQKERDEYLYKLNKEKDPTQ